MKLIHKIWMISGGVLLLTMLVMGVLFNQHAEKHIDEEILKTARILRDLLMTVRYTYHQRFIESGLPVSDQTLGLLPAHAMSGMSENFSRYHRQGILFRNVSDRPRNLANQADADELEAIQWFRDHPQEKEHFVKRDRMGEVRYLYAAPIRIETYCLDCHGNIAAAPASISKRYATGYDYQLGELSGILSISIPESVGVRSVSSSILREETIQFGSFILALLLSGMLINHFVIRRLRGILSAIERYTDGDYATRLSLSGNDEITQLASRMNTVADTIQQNQSSLRQSVTLFHTMADWTSDWEYWVSPEGHFVYISPSVETITGYGVTDFEHDPDLVNKIVHPEDRPRWESHIERHLPDNTHTNVSGMDFRIVRKDGDTRWVSHRCRPVLGEHGEYLGRRVSVQDISARKQYEVELEQHRNHLEDLVTQQTEELRTAKDIAERLARTKSEFLANMSHEIRTPLNGVLGLAQIGHRDSHGRTKTKETFARIHDSGKLLLTILNDILDFSKIEAGKLTVEHIPFDPARVAEDAIAALAENANAKNLPLIVEKAGDLPMACLGDPVRISQILLNLLSNAIKFTAHGEIRLSVRAQHGKLIFTVTDTGIGITGVDLQRLFMPFEQADKSTTRKYGGTGLGLTISRRLAELMRGSLTAQSEAGKGASFELQLPLMITDLPLSVPAKAAPSGQRLSGLRLLVVEDNETNRLVIADILKNEDALFVMAANGRLAVEAVASAQGSFHAVLMDLQMPEMDGIEATLRLRQIAPGLPIIGQTAHALKEEHDRCIAAGMAATLTKPIDIETLVCTLLDVVHRMEVAKPHIGTHSQPSLKDLDPEAVLPVIDWDALAQRYPNRRSFIELLIRQGLTDHAGDPERIRSHAAAEDLAPLEFMAHNLKGFAGNLFALEVARQAARTLEAVRTGDLVAIPLSIGLAEAMERLLDTLRQGLPRNFGS